MWVRGLKRYTYVCSKYHKRSHPMWVRGLKLNLMLSAMRLLLVAPYVGAWIETCSSYDRVKQKVSHPMWVRGLKHNDRTALR